MHKWVSRRCDWVVPLLAMPDHIVVLYESLPAAVTTGWERVVTDVVTDGTVAAPTKSNTQAAANNLSRKGRTACRREVVRVGGRKGGKGGACERPLAIIRTLI